MAKEQNPYERKISRQSDMHHMLSDFFGKNNNHHKIHKESQLNKKLEKNSTRVIMTDENKAYWVKDNIFFVADTQNGKVINETTRPIDTINMSKKDLDKMLFILDKLKSGGGNDNSSSRNI